MINEIVPSKDGVIRKVIVRYRNHQVNVDRYTSRSVCHLVLIHPIHKLKLLKELGNVNSQQGIRGNEYLNFFVLGV